MVDHDMKKVAAEDAANYVKMNLAEYLEKGIVKELAIANTKYFSYLCTCLYTHYDESYTIQ